MLDGEHVIVADHPQIGNEVTPPGQGMAIADRSEGPGPVQDIGIRFGVQGPVDAGVVRVNARVLGVDMEDRTGLAQHSDGGDGVNALPPEVGRVEVRADLGARCIAQLEDGFGVVDQKAGVCLNGELDVVLFQKPVLLLPVGDGDLLPLVI